MLQVVSDFVDFDDELTTLRDDGRGVGPAAVALARPARAPAAAVPPPARRARRGQRRRAGDAGPGRGAGDRHPPRPARLGEPVRPARPTYRASSPTLPLAEHVAQLRRAGGPRGDRRRVRARRRPRCARRADPSRIFALGDAPDYEPDAGDERRRRRRRAAASTRSSSLYDLLLEQDGRALLYIPVLNYADGNLDAVGEMLAHPHAVPGLSDGGAHVGTICDGSFPTTLLTHWGRDRSRGARFALPWLISRQSRATAETVGLRDRGLLAPGLRADINVIDFDALRLHPPELSFDLPAGGKRLLQRVDGYRAHVRRRRRDLRRRRAHRRAPRPPRAGGTVMSATRMSPACGTPHRRADHLRRLAHHRAAEHLHRLHRSRRSATGRRRWSIDGEKLGDVFVIEGMSRPLSLATAAAAGKPPEEIKSSAAPASTTSTAAAGTRRPAWPTRTATASPPR